MHKDSWHGAPAARRRKLGQHFLTSPGAILRVIEGIGPVRDEAILEIGPGRGALTFPLLAAGSRVLALELDASLARRLRQQGAAHSGLQVADGDVLKADFDTLLAGWLPAGTGVRVVGNLPYSVASPAILRLLARPDLFRDWTLMVQREVADRILASPGSRLFGVMTLLCASRAVPRRLMDLPPGSFSPPPRVHSTLLHFAPRSGMFCSTEHAESFERVVKAAFSARRKMLRNTLAGGLRWTVERAQAALAEAGIPSEERPEKIPLDAYLDLSRRLAGAAEKGASGKPGHL
ncbi:MAG TPA: 16S rRNA (adenine(1518)-N(6)/adenine(1519)-N(6))-dimethyltransferase RsmA [Candidatus Polarisedimenticolia bacterium]|nr:16S rRNA (adenine(1518)-N(6)/adenine(1519)-N(6))-dimethyltransferase RsmA [Candidatus Polarisedimenticolia bacterium]